MNYVYFDGTSSFVGSKDDYQVDYEILFKSRDLNECDEFINKNDCI